MIFHSDNSHGADRDGNRGMPIWEYQFEPSDRVWILPQIMMYLETTDDPSPTISVEWLNPITEEIVDLDITIQDWL